MKWLKNKAEKQAYKLNKQRIIGDQNIKNGNEWIKILFYNDNEQRKIIQKLKNTELNP